MKRRGDNFPDNGFEEWGGYMNAKIAKLEEQFSSRACREEQVTDIFRGVSIYVNGYTKPSTDELKSLMAKHGGTYHTYQRSDDFIIASNLPDTKLKNMHLDKVVKPEWITDSLIANKLLDYRNYLLYSTVRGQTKLKFKVCDTPVDLEKEDIDEIPDTFIEKPMNEKSEISSSKLEQPDASINKEMSFKSEPSIKPEITKTAADPDFISEFYNNSRLHHISQLGTCFKQHINDMRESSNFQFPDRDNLKQNILSKLKSTSQISFEGGKSIMHIDMDCFFVSVGLRNHPEFKGKPVAVTHSKGGQARSKRPGVDRRAEFNLYKQKQAKKVCKNTGLDENAVVIETRVDNLGDENDKFGSMSEIASCSYEARSKGVSNGMFMGKALRLCPDLQTIPYDFEGYKEVAYTLYNTVAQYTLDIEAVSCDEMYVDCTELLKSLDISVQDFATVLREEIKQKTGCPCSTGFGGNRLQARLATKKAKPDGQFFLFAELVDDFMFDIKLSDLPGVGRQTSLKLETLGHETCGSLQTMSLSSLQTHLGNKTGSQLHDQCRGKDPHPLNFLTVRKSVSAEVNYGIRFESNEQCFNFLGQLSSEVQSRMRQFKVNGKCITLKLMVRAEEAPVETAKFMGHGFCDVINKSVNLNAATDDAEVITKEVIGIFKKQHIAPNELRGVGIQVTKLEIISTKPVIGAMNKFLAAQPKLSKPVNNECDTRAQIKKEKFPSPAKHLPRSPKNKSPILINKSPLKRRGRPPKNASFKVQSTTTKNNLSRFFQCASKDTIVKEEINTIAKVDKESKVDIAEKKDSEKAIGLIGLPWTKVRDLLRAWLACGKAPLLCDIKLITSYMTEMVISKNLSDLVVLLRFVKRNVAEMECEKWTQVFCKILDQVQDVMIAVYGKRLQL